MNNEQKLIMIMGFLLGLKTKLKPDDQNNIDKLIGRLELEKLIEVKK